MNPIADKIYQLRLKNKLTQENVADELGISQTSYRLYENGKTPLKPNRAKQLAKIFNCKPEDLYEFDVVENQIVNEPKEQYITLSEQGKAKSNDYIDSLKSVIDVIKHTLSTMESELRSKNKQIDFLQNRILELEKKTK